MIDGLKDLLEMYEKTFPGKWGNRVGVALLVTVTLAAFAFSISVICRFFILPAYTVVLGFIQFWPSLGIGSAVPEKIWAAVLTSALAGLFSGASYNFLARFTLSGKVRQILLLQATLEKSLADIRRIGLDVRRDGDALREQQNKDLADFKRRWDELGAQHAGNKKIMRSLVAQFDTAMGMLQVEMAKAGASPVESPALQSPPNTETETPQ